MGNFKLRLLPVIIYAAVVFLLVRGYSFYMDIGYWTDIPIHSDQVMYDVFSYVKAKAIVYVTIWSALTMAYLLLSGQMKIKKTKLYIPMAIYTALVFLSYIMSDYKYMAWDGCPNRFEGTKIILCYMFMLFYTINVVDEIKDAIVIIAPTMVGVFIACLIGFSQLIGQDVLVSKIGSSIIARDVVIEGEFAKGQVYQTVYNMNYVGLYLTLIVPILLVALVKLYDACKGHRFGEIGFNSKQVKAIIVFISLLLVLIALNVYGADSVGGVMGIIASIVMLIIFNEKRIWLKAVLFIISICGFVDSLAFMYATGEDEIKQIDYVVTGNDSILISIDGNELYIDYLRDIDEYALYDAKGNKLKIAGYKGKEGQFQVEDERFRGKFALIPIDNDGEPVMYFDAFNEEFLFRMKEDGVMFINPYRIDIPLDKVESVGFKGHLKAGSGRGYIWSRTIPLLKKHLLLGSGADTFILEFPQQDYAGKYSAETFWDVLFDKAHNLFLMMFVCTGGLSMCAYIVMLSMFVKMIAVAPPDSYLVKAIGAGVIGFCIAGLFNDSNVSVMPIFYSIFGIGIALVIGSKENCKVNAKR